MGSGVDYDRELRPSVQLFVDLFPSNVVLTQENKYGDDDVYDEDVYDDDDS